MSEMNNREHIPERRSSHRNDNTVLFGGLLVLGMVVGVGWYFLRRKDEPIYHVKPITGINEPNGTYATGEDWKEPTVAVKISAPTIDIKISTASGVTSVKAELPNKDDAIRKNHYEQIKQNIAQATVWKYKDGILQVTVIKAVDIDKKDSNDSDIDPFVQLKLGDKSEQTKYLGDKNPVWNEKFDFEVKDATRDELFVQLYDRGTLINDKIGDQFGITVMDVCKKGGLIENFVIAVPGTKTTKLVLSLSYKEED